MAEQINSLQVQRQKWIQLYKKVMLENREEK